LWRIIGVIELLHPVTLGVAVACVPVATVAVSGAIDLITHRQHQHQSAGAALELAATPSKESTNTTEGQPHQRG
jgi:hypothetical protein